MPFHLKLSSNLPSYYKPQGYVSVPDMLYILNRKKTHVFLKKRDLNLELKVGKCLIPDGSVILINTINYKEKLY